MLLVVELFFQIFEYEYVILIFIIVMYVYYLDYNDFINEESEV